MIARGRNHGLTDPQSPAGLLMSDVLDLDAVEASLGYLCLFADLAREHARVSDLEGLEHDLARVRAHFIFALKKFQTIQGRHAKASRNEAVP